MNGTEDWVIHRVMVALEPGRQSLAALSGALLLAERRHAELVALLIEEEALLQLAALPFTREVLRGSGTLGPLDADRLAITWRRGRDRLHRELLDLARARNVAVTVQSVRGHWLAAALEAHDMDVLFLGVTGQAGVSVLTRRRGPAIRPRPVWVLYDDSAAARRALLLAGELSRPEAIDLIVLVRGESAEQSWQLRREIDPLLGESATGVHYRPVVDADLPGQLDAVRRQGGSLLILPRSSPLLQQPSTLAMLDSVGCPVVLVR